MSSVIALHLVDRQRVGVLQVGRSNVAAPRLHKRVGDRLVEVDPEIDLQLYAKYGLGRAEKAFIEVKVKPME